MALTLMREGWPTTMGARPAWAGLPSRTMLPASRALVMVSGARPSSWERAARCWSRRPRRAALRERMEDMVLHPSVWTQGAKKATTCFRGCGSTSLRQCELRQVHRVWDYPTLNRTTAVHGSPSCGHCSWLCPGCKGQPPERSACNSRAAGLGCRLHRAPAAAGRSVWRSAGSAGRPAAPVVSLPVPAGQVPRAGGQRDDAS